MGETLHCYGYSNSRILWKPYLGGGIEYRYPSEAWQTITAQNRGELTYTTQENNLNCTFPYRVKFKVVNSPLFQFISNTGRCSYWDVDHSIASQENSNPGAGLASYYVWGPIYGWQVADTGNAYRNCSNDLFSHVNLRGKLLNGARKIQILCHGFAPSPGGSSPPRLSTPTWVTWFNGYRSVSLQYFLNGLNSVWFEVPSAYFCPTTCTFKVFEDGIEIFTRTETVCPEVKQVECKTDPDAINQGIGISKQGNQLVLVTDQEYSVNPQGYVVTTPLADNQLNVYKVTPKGDIDSNNSYELIEQIASECQDKRPEYQVNCLGKETCPPNTCEVDCGNHICCYDKNGYPVKTIQK
jgi:hypothetical protein